MFIWKPRSSGLGSNVRPCHALLQIAYLTHGSKFWHKAPWPGRADLIQMAPDRTSLIKLVKNNALPYLSWCPFDSWAEVSLRTVVQLIETLLPANGLWTTNKDKAWKSVLLGWWANRLQWACWLAYGLRPAQNCQAENSKRLGLRSNRLSTFWSKFARFRRVWTNPTLLRP